MVQSMQVVRTTLFHPAGRVLRESTTSTATVYDARVPETVTSHLVDNDGTYMLILRI